LIKGLDWQGAALDISGAAAFLRSKGCKKVGVTGFCMGGALAILAVALDSTIDASAPFYGIPDLSKCPIQNIKVPVFGIFAEHD